MGRIPQEEWDERAAAVGMRWLEPVNGANTPTMAECLKCGYAAKKYPGSTQQGIGCRACAGKAPVSQAEWDQRAATVGIRWLEPVKTRMTPTMAECLRCGYVSKKRPGNVQQGRGCASCAGVAPISQADWNERISALGMRWLEPVKNDATPTMAECLRCGYTAKKHPSNVQRGIGCRACAGKAPISQAEWDERAAAVGLRWLEPVRSSTTPTAAECLVCGYKSRKGPGQVQQGSGCRACVGLAPLNQAEWDMRAAEVGMRWLEPVRNATTPTTAECLKCRGVYRKIPSTAQAGQGCGICRGKDPDAPAAVYLLVSEQLGLMKVGVTNRTKNSSRLTLHRRRGWEVIQVWAIETRRRAFEIESAVIEHWEAAGAIRVDPEEVPNEDGHTETVRVGRVDVPGTVRFVDALTAEQSSRGHG